MEYPWLKPVTRFTSASLPKRTEILLNHFFRRETHGITRKSFTENAVKKAV
jgi:hypothetical protein